MSGNKRKNIADIVKINESIQESSSSNENSKASEYRSSGVKLPSEYWHRLRLAAAARSKKEDRRVSISEVIESLVAENLDRLNADVAVLYEQEKS